MLNDFNFWKVCVKYSKEEEKISKFCIIVCWIYDYCLYLMSTRINSYSKIIYPIIFIENNYCFITLQVTEKKYPARKCCGYYFDLLLCLLKIYLLDLPVLFFVWSVSVVGVSRYIAIASLRTACVLSQR